MSLLRMLRQFHYIDVNGKDQGINVRNRSSELVKLLGDVDQIRSERKKARTNRNKFGGFEGGMGVGGGMSSGSSRYGGFGSDSMGYGGYSGGVYGDGGGFGGATSDFQDSSRDTSSRDTSRRGNRFEEYDEYDEGETGAPRRESAAPAPKAKAESKKPEPAPVVDLFDFGDDEPVTTTSTAAGKQPASNALNVLDSTADDDDFDDFQSATPAVQPSAPATANYSIQPPASTHSTTANTQFAAPVPVSASQGANINGIVGFTSATPTPSTSSLASPVSQTAPMQQPMAAKPSGYQATTPNYFTSVSTGAAQPFSSHAAKPSLSSPAASTAASKPAASTASKSSGDAFGSLWSTASASAGISKANANASKGPNLASMAKEKASAGIWGAPAASASPAQYKPQQKQGGGSAFDDLLG
jgi:epsin